jgi:hypothetical protein
VCRPSSSPVGSSIVSGWVSIQYDSRGPARDVDGLLVGRARDRRREPLIAFGEANEIVTHGAESALSRIGSAGDRRGHC